MPETATTIELTAEIVAAYVGNHQIAASDLPALIRTVYGGFTPEPAATTAAAPELTGTQIRKSVSPDAIVSFEDGRRYKLLRRHLSTRGLTPETYRAKWGLPSDYPMVAPAYSEQRSALALARGLGRKKAAPAPATKTARKPRAPRAPNT